MKELLQQHKFKSKKDEENLAILLMEEMKQMKYLNKFQMHFSKVRESDFSKLKNSWNDSRHLISIWLCIVWIVYIWKRDDEEMATAKNENT